MILDKQLSFNIVTYFVDKVYFKERLSTNKFKNNSGFTTMFRRIKQIVYRLLRCFKRHSLMSVFAHEITIFTNKLAIFGNYEGYIFRFFFSPAFGRIFYIIHI